jgi:hypothetical protein
VLARAVWIALVTFAVAGFFSTASYHFPFYYLTGLAIAVRAVAAGAPRLATAVTPAPVVPAGAALAGGAGWWRR